jgi:hypothetical protein
MGRAARLVLVGALAFARPIQAHAQAFADDPALGSRRTTYPANAGAWPLLVGSAAVGGLNLVQAPMGKSRMWGVTGIGLGLVATTYGKITLENETSSRDLALGTMTAGLLTSAASRSRMRPK